MSAGYVGIMDWAFLPCGVGAPVVPFHKAGGFRGAGRRNGWMQYYYEAQRRKSRFKAPIATHAQFLMNEAFARTQAQAVSDHLNRAAMAVLLAEL